MAVIELAQTRKAILLQKGREKQKETLKRGDEMPVLSIMDKTEEHNTRKKIADELGWSTGKVAMAVIYLMVVPVVYSSGLKSLVFSDICPFLLSSILLTVCCEDPEPPPASLRLHLCLAVIVLLWCVPNVVKKWLKVFTEIRHLSFFGILYDIINSLLWHS